MGKVPKAFRQMAVERLNHCENIVELGKELGISGRLLYMWREHLEPVERGDAQPATLQEATFRKEVLPLKRVLAEKVQGQQESQRHRVFPSRPHRALPQ